MTRDGKPHDTPLRLVVQQSALPKYRVPVYRELAHRPGIRFSMYYGDDPGSPPSVAADGFEAACVHQRSLNVLGRHLLWHPPQWRFAARDRADVLLMEWNLHYAGLAPALLRARRQGVGTVLWGHGYSKHDAGWRSWPRRKVTALADALLFYNHTAARRYVDQWGVDPGRVFVALNSLDQTPIQAARQHWLDRPDELAAFRRDAGLEPEAPVVLFVSRLDPDNRVDLLLHAARQLAGDYPKMRVIVVGKGPDDQRLRGLSQELGLESHVRFLGAIYDEARLAPWFLNADVFCYPANIGLSALHAFGYGLPVVTGNRLESQNPEIEALRDGENGLLYADGDPGALAAALRRLFDDRDLTRRLSRAAHDTVLQRFTLSNMVDGMEAAVRYAYDRASGRAGR